LWITVIAKVEICCTEFKGFETGKVGGRRAKEMEKKRWKRRQARGVQN
jgi:hypothetical protein